MEGTDGTGNPPEQAQSGHALGHGHGPGGFAARGVRTPRERARNMRGAPRRGFTPRGRNVLAACALAACVLALCVVTPG